jgi:site-specific DNA-methyltransferase (adenine-specific)
MSLSNIKLIQGDCIQVMDSLISQGIKVDAIITDPPYGTTACKWDSVIPFDEMWNRLNKLIKPNGAIVLFGSEPFSSALRMSNIKMYKYDWIWKKPQGVDPFMSKIRPLNNIENIVVFCYGKTPYIPQKTIGKPYVITRDKTSRVKETNGTIMKETTTINHGQRLPTRVLEFNQQRGFHPTQKPVPLMEYLIKTYTNENETVLDFTMGSGTTGVACKNTNRDFIGIELDKNYFEIAEKRCS